MTSEAKANHANYSSEELQRRMLMRSYHLSIVFAANEVSLGEHAGAHRGVDGGARLAEFFCLEGLTALDLKRYLKI